MSRQKKYKMKAILDKGEPSRPKSAITRVFSEGHEGKADTLVTIDEDAIVTAMRAWCDEADSSLDIPAGGTVKLTLSDGTELTRHVSFGE